LGALWWGSRIGASTERQIYEMIMISFACLNPENLGFQCSLFQDIWALGSSEQAHFISEIMGPNLATDSCEKSQSTTQRSVESRGFSLGALVSSHREC
jgi:hypothetical protein